MNPKKTLLALLAMLSAMIIGQRARITSEMKTLGVAAKFLVVFAFSLFATLALLHGLDLLPEFLSIWSIDIPF